MTDRRSLLLGLTGFVACAPAIVRASSLMPVRNFLSADLVAGLRVLPAAPATIYVTDGNYELEYLHGELIKAVAKVAQVPIQYIFPRR